MKKFIFAIIALAFTAIPVVNAQATLDPKFGDDPAQRGENVKLLNYFSDAYQTKAYDDALAIYKQLLTRAPKASLNMYINAGDIYRNKMARATTKAERAAYLDSMLYVLDCRIEHFGSHPTRGHAYLAAQKALLFNENNQIDRDRAFKLFQEAIAVGKHEVDPEMAAVYFNTLTEGFKLDDITPEEYLRDFDNLMFLLGNVSVTEDDEVAMTQIESLFASSGAASCENIEKIYRPKYEADPNNTDLIKQIVGLFARSKCGTDFQLELTEKYYKAEPTPELAMMLGGVYEGKQQYAKAVEYFNIGISQEQDQAKKANILIRAAGATIAMSDYRAAADYSRQLIAIDPENGFGYMFLAGAYAGGAKNCSGFEQQAAYWLVVDTYIQARAKFADDPDQLATINRLIGSYSAGFPKVEDTFMRGLEPGQGYTVNCGWLSGRTTVRER